MLDPSQYQPRYAYGHAERFFGLAADFDAGRLYAASSDRGIHVFELAGEKREAVARWEGHANYVTALAFVPRTGGSRLVSAGYDRKLAWWDAASGSVAHAVDNAHDGWIRDLVLLPGGALVATAADDMQVKLWDAESGALVRTLAGHATRTPQGHVTALYALAASPDGQWLAAGDRVGEVRVWSVETGETAQTFQVPVLYTYDPRQRKRSIGGIRSLAFSPDGARLAAGGIGQIDNVDGLAGPLTVELWDWRQPSRLATLAAGGHQALVNALAFHPTEPWLAGAGGGSGNGVLAFWKIDSLPQAEAPDKPATPLEAIKATFDGHAHRLLPRPDWSELYLAGQGKLEAWGR